MFNVFKGPFTNNCVGGVMQNEALKSLNPCKIATGKIEFTCVFVFVCLFFCFVLFCFFFFMGFTHNFHGKKKKKKKKKRGVVLIV